MNAKQIFSNIVFPWLGASKALCLGLAQLSRHLEHFATFPSLMAAYD
jgi:hypothetical protein